VKEPIVVDSTCLIGLERIGRLDLLSKLFSPIVVPPEVAREFGVSLDWLKIESPANEALVKSLKLVIDHGEAEAIALGYEKHWRVLLDDRQARAVAKRMGLTIIGTVGALVLAKRQSIIPALTPLLTQLAAHNFYLSADLREEALRLVNE
jgi:predicted nucleic acid-binding protein